MRDAFHFCYIYYCYHNTHYISSTPFSNCILLYHCLVVLLEECHYYHCFCYHGRIEIMLYEIDPGFSSTVFNQKKQEPYDLNTNSKVWRHHACHP